MAKILDLTLIIARLQAQLTGFRGVGASAELDAALDGPVASPQAFVIPIAEAATALDLLGQTSQRISQLFGVLVCVSNRRDSQGAAALTDLHAARLQIRTALVGWIPVAVQAEPVHFVAGRLMKMDGDGRLWWMDDFELVQRYWSPL